MTGGLMMDKETAHKLKNLRNGIAVGAAAVTVSAVSIPAQAQEQDTSHKIEIKTQERAPLTQGATYLAEEEFLYNLHFDNGKVYYVNSETEIQDLSDELRDPQEIIHSQKSELRKEYKRLKPEDIYKEGKIVVDGSNEMNAQARFDFKEKTITVNTVEYSDDYLRKYIANNVLGDEDKYQNLAKILETPYPNMEQMTSYLKDKLDKMLNSPEAMESSRAHEEGHMEDDKNGANLAGISPLQYANHIQTQEIGANICELLKQRENYLKTGDIDKIKYDFYKEAILNKEVVPGSRVKELEDADFSLIMNGMQKHWQETSQEDYTPQIAGLGKKFAAENPAGTIISNQSELERRERNSLTFKINGHEVNLMKFRTERLPLTENVREQVSAAYLDKIMAYTPQNIELARHIKSEEQLNKMKLERCGSVNDAKQKNKAMLILEKQGRIMKPQQKKNNNGENRQNSPQLKKDFDFNR